ncbi:MULTISPECIES: DUF6651 domain-containing protein [unclassified Ensifer]|uniref:DUF6651 domain-containing protein n=1 Tax=unclassified Ensifer TaxID=2633371 RepID=UPI001146836E|nr:MULTISPECIES: DUF6651 domain-containing protein [unclassified Ensifer]
MTKLLTKYSRAASFGAFAARPMYPGAPRIAFAPENEGGNDGGGSDDGAGTGDDKSGDDKSGDDKTGSEDKGKSGDDKTGDDKNKTGDGDKTLLREVMEKKNRIKDLESDLKRFEGIDPDAVRALLEEKRAAELKAEEEKGNFARVKEMMVIEQDKALKSLNDQIADLQAQLGQKDSTINELTVGRSFSESKFIGEDLVLTRGKARALYSSHFEVVDGRIVGYDKPVGAKDRTEIVGADGKPVSFEDAIKRIVDADPDKESLYRDKSKPGAGSSSTKVDLPKTKEQDKGLYGAGRILAGLNAGK